MCIWHFRGKLLGPWDPPSSLFPECRVPAREQRTVRLPTEAGLHGATSFEFPGRLGLTGPRQRPALRVAVPDDSQPLCFTFSPQHKREG